jgi:hypothetical protein
MTHEEVLAGEERLRSGKSVLDVGCHAGFIDGDPSRSATGLCQETGSHRVNHGLFLVMLR